MAREGGPSHLAALVFPRADLVQRCMEWSQQQLHLSVPQVGAYPQWQEDMNELLKDAPEIVRKTSLFYHNA